MRNQPKPLSHEDRRWQNIVRMGMVTAMSVDMSVQVRYTKRNGEVGNSTGKVIFFNGTPGMDTGSFTLDTADKGQRTINLHRVIGWRTEGDAQ